MSAPGSPRPESPVSREARTARRLLWLLPTSTLLLVLGIRLLVTSEPVTRRIAAELASELANRTRASVQLSGVTFAWDLSPCFQDLQLYRDHGPFRLEVVTQEACVERWASAVGSGFRAVRLRLDHPSIALEGDPERGATGAFVDVQPSTSTTSATRQRRALREVEIVFDDLRLAWTRLPLPARLASGEFGPIDGAVTVQMRGDQTAAVFSIREPVTGSQLGGRVAPSRSGWDLSAGVEGDVVSIFKDLLATPDVDIRKMPSSGRLGATYATTSRKLTVDLDMEQADVDLASQVVAKTRLVGFSARERLRLQVDLEERTLRLEEGLVEINGVPLEISLRLDPGPRSPLFAIELELRTTPLARLLRSVPGSEEPALSRAMSPGIVFAASFAMNGELGHPLTWQVKLDHGLQGLDAGRAVTGLEPFRRPFQYQPLTREGRRPTPLEVGPGTPTWQPYRTIPYVLRRAVIVSEDSTFPFHRGLEIEEVRAALQTSLERGERARGGSTITQQLVKNLFLTRDRTALRKLQELLLTFYVESVLTKEEIFELYMNVIEWGPDLYGVRPAAQHYFGRPPEALAPLEMAYLATIIPNPVELHRHYETGQVPPAHVAKVVQLLERLHRLGQLSENELAAAREGRIRFYRPRSRGKQEEEP